MTDTVFQMSVTLSAGGAFFVLLCIVVIVLLIGYVANAGKA